MTKKMGLMALGLSMVLLSGCTDAIDELKDKYEEYKDDKDEHEEQYEEHKDEYQEEINEVLNSPEVAKRNIVGTWIEECDDYGNGESGSELVTFNADNTAGFERTEYLSSDCTGNIIGTDSGLFSYEIGEATTALNGEDAVEVDVAFSNGIVMYSMVHFNENKLYLADDEDDNGDDLVNDGSTPELRADKIDLDEGLTKQ